MNLRLLLLALASLLVACPPLQRGDDDDSVDVPPLDDDDVADDDDSTDPADDDDSTDPADDDDATDPLDDGPLGFVGSPCDSDLDCDFEDGPCLFEYEGFPRGMCSVGCDLFCPDADGHPVTFCVDGAEFVPDEPAAEALGDGACATRCDFEYFPDTGCRPDYGCVVTARANETWTEKYSCLPNRDTDLTSCHLELAARGIAFEPTFVAPDSPAGNPNLQCGIEEPVYILSPLLGADLLYFDGAPTNRVLAACDMAHALADTVVDVLPYDVTELLHIGTYNCRVISGTDTLSRHSFADAIDIYGFGFSDGEEYTLVDDWDHDTTNPPSAGGEFLYDAAYRWYDDDIWNIILTPNYNSAHDNHFHVDLTPGSDYIGLTGNRFIGANPYGDE
ncbi:MAG: extensin family protein [Deltaproteobacteria bacterium]|nr:extensin family protein [Deltaproteobacteria bacterium]